MYEYDKLYWKKMKISAAAHLIALAALICVNFTQGCLHGRENASDDAVEFTVAIPDGSLNPVESTTTVEAPAEAQPAPVEDSANIKEIPPEPAVSDIVEQPKQEAKRQKPKIERSKEVVKVKADPNQTPKPQPSSKPLLAPEYKGPRYNSGSELSEAEIRQMIADGAKPGATTVKPSDAKMGLIKIKTALYAVWNRPSSEHNTGRGAEVKIRIGASGVVLDFKLTSSSMNDTFDKSVRDAVAAVNKFDGLSKDFLATYADGVTVKFELQ